MDKETLEKWTGALRSGEYEQGQGYLRQTDKEAGIDRFCCLGVLYDLMRPEGWQKRPYLSTVYLTDVGASGALGSEMLYEVGLHKADANDLANMNDAGNTFEEIADFLDALHEVRI